MRFRSLATLTLLVLVALSSSCRDPEEAAAAARYEVAIEWVNLIKDGEVEKAAERLIRRRGLNAVTLAQSWTRGPATYGTMSSLEPKRQEMQDGLHRVILEGLFTDGAWDLEVVMTDDHMVPGYRFYPRTPN